MEIVDCCNMGLKLRAELEVCLTLLAMSLGCRCSTDAYTPCEEYKSKCGACPCGNFKERNRTQNTCRAADMLAPFWYPRIKLHARQWLCCCSISTTAGILPSSALAGCGSDFLRMTESLQIQTSQTVSCPELLQARLKL